MITLLFWILMFAIFGRLFIFALKAAWSITKIVVCVIFAPAILIGLVAAGLIYVAFIFLIIAGIVSLIGTLA